MYLDCFDEVRSIAKELIKIPSVVRTNGEKDCATWIYNYYKELSYFIKNPQYLNFQKTEDDDIERYNTIAMVRGTKADSNRTIIMMGHLDTVGVDDFGEIKDYAFDSDNLLELIRQSDPGEDVLKDIDSKEYMFGRGSLDMKSGIAGHMYLIKYFSEHPEELDGNIIAIAECAQEDNSHGIISALTLLLEWKKQYNLDFISAINAGYSTPYHEKDENRYIYFGTVGKLLPSFYVMGKRTHVGQAFAGLNPNIIISELNRNIELNPDLCDISQGEITLPPTSLKQCDTKKEYTVQTPLSAYSYYYFFTHGMSPKDILLKIKEKAVESFNQVIIRLNEQYKHYCELGNHVYTKLPWETRVYSWEEFYNEILTIRGYKFKVFLHNFADNLNKKNPSMDLKDFSVQVIEAAWEWSVDKSPTIIIYYSSTFSGRIEMTGKTQLEQQLLDSVNKSICLVQGYSDRPIMTKMFYPYISDTSFMAISDDTYELNALENNMPAWGTKYIYPIDEILEINVPVVNIGGIGKDVHKMTERVHMKYTFEHVPNLTYNTIRNLIG